MKLAAVSDKNGKQAYKNVELRFIDSCRFMASSLDKLTKNLDDEQCKNLRSVYHEEDGFQLRACIPMSIWIAGSDLRRPNSHPKKPSTTS